MPLAADFRLLAMGTKTGCNRPFILNPVTGKLTEVPLPDFAGDVSVMDWSPDGRRVLLAQTYQARQKLVIYELATAQLPELNHPGGFYGVSMIFAPIADLLEIAVSNTAIANS